MSRVFDDVPQGVNYSHVCAVSGPWDTGRAGDCLGAAQRLADALGNVPCVMARTGLSPGPTAAETCFPLACILGGPLSPRAFEAALCLPLCSAAPCPSGGGSSSAPACAHGVQEESGSLLV